VKRLIALENYFISSYDCMTRRDKKEILNLGQKNKRF